MFLVFVCFEENVVWKGEKECESENAKKSYTFVIKIIHIIVKMGKRINKKKKNIQIIDTLFVGGVISESRYQISDINLSILKCSCTWHEHSTDRTTIKVAHYTLK